ncbi:hypothetical protein B0H19DRAFT_923643, partial [Mycena capillaripes]
KYISAFGGDPDRVVINFVYSGGLSAGAISTGVLLSNKQSSNALFRGAFLVNRSPITLPSIADGQSTYDGLVAANNCSTSSDTLDCLRRVLLDSFMFTVNQTRNLF